MSPEQNVSSGITQSAETSPQYPVTNIKELQAETRIDFRPDQRPTPTVVDKIASGVATLAARLGANGIVLGGGAAITAALSAGFFATFSQTASSDTPIFNIGVRGAALIGAVAGVGLARMLGQDVIDS